MFSYRALRSLVTRSRPPQSQYLYGELFVNLADNQLGVIDESQIPQDLLAITFHSNLAQYTQGDHVIYNGDIYIANKDITTPANFDPDDWNRSGLDLSVADYDPTKAYKRGTTAFFPNFGCFLTASVDIPANEAYDKTKWEFPCTADPADPGLPDRPGQNNGSQVGDIIATAAYLSATDRAEMRLLRCNGASISRATYAALFAKIGGQWGTPDNSTFRVPDMRGFFIRDVSQGSGRDPDAATRTAIYAGGVGGDEVGTRQADEFKQHHHFWRLDNNEPIREHGAADDNDMQNGMRATVGNPGGKETRPTNITLYHWIRY